MMELEAYQDSGLFQIEAVDYDQENSRFLKQPKKPGQFMFADDLSDEVVESSPEPQVENLDSSRQDLVIDTYE